MGLTLEEGRESGLCTALAGTLGALGGLRDSGVLDDAALAGAMRALISNKFSSNNAVTM